ncbi:MAG: shikimate dehydrogenase [Muribaculaceae bacterium]|nr:shikimate dehydrogenase [Muribaculaceae bacterium]
MAPDFINKTLYGLIGYPLSHSLSMSFFNRKFSDENINAAYLNFEIEDIGQLMEIFAQYPQLQGLNVTAPYKEQVIPYLSALHESARQIGAVNVIKVIRGAKENELKLIGYNTDIMAFKLSVEPLLDDKKRSAMILGTGGAAKAVECAFHQLGIDVTFVSRRKTAHTVTYEEITKAMVAKNKIIVNATPLGKYPDVDACPDFPYRFISQEHLCYDLIYNPDETLFMKKALARGADVKNGLEMLLLQAFESYKIWTSPESEG